MLGFAGLVDFSNRHVDDGQVDKMLADGLKVDDSVCEKIADESFHCKVHSHHQSPIFTTNEIIFIAKARLDDKPELYKTLHLSCQFIAQLTDEGLLFEAYKKWGNSLVDYVSGDFALVVWHKSRQQLTLLRDHVGVKMLAYAHYNNQVIFATSIKSLLAGKLVRRQLNLDKLTDFLILEQQSDSQTFFAGVNIVPAGHLITIDVNGLSTKKYWQPWLTSRRKIEDKQELFDQFTNIFSNAVMSRLSEHAQNGVMLSGGLDSGAVACMAAKHLNDTGRTLNSYTSVPLASFDKQPDKGIIYDETPYVEAIQSDYSNINANYLDAGQYNILSILDPFFESTCAPPRNLGNHLWMQAIVDKAHDDGCKSVLTGFAGNHFISRGGRGHLIEHFLTGNWRILHKQLAHLSRHQSQGYLELLKRIVLIPLLPRQMWVKYMQIRWRQSIIDYRQLAINPELLSDKEISRRCRQLDPYFRRTPDWKKEAAAMLEIFSGDLCTFESAIENANGISLLDPTRDKRLIEFCFSLPAEMYFNNSRSRLLIRDGMKNILPETIINRNEFGIQEADLSLRLNQNREQIKLELNNVKNHDIVRKFIDLPRINDYLEHSDFLNSTSVNVVSRGLIMAKFIAWAQP